MRAIGDSHVRIFRYLGIEAVYAGPVLMHRIGRDGLIGLQQLVKFEGMPNELIAWSFGEIDVRCHLAERVEANGDIVLTELVDSFVKTIEAFNTQYQTRTAIVSVPPASDGSDALFPRRGTGTLRTDITAKVNNLLRARCDTLRYLFIDTHTPTFARNGGIKGEYTDDGTHLNARAATEILHNLIRVELETVGTQT